MLYDFSQELGDFLKKRPNVGLFTFPKDPEEPSGETLQWENGKRVQFDIDREHEKFSNSAHIHLRFCIYLVQYSFKDLWIHELIYSINIGCL